MRKRKERRLSPLLSSLKRIGLGSLVFIDFWESRHEGAKPAGGIWGPQSCFFMWSAPCLCCLWDSRARLFMWAIILFGGYHVQIISMPKMSLFMVKGTEDPVV